MKIGLLGILTLSLLWRHVPLWWGVALLVLGMITSPPLSAVCTRDYVTFQRLLAYHTLENIGIILLGLGAGVTGMVQSAGTDRAGSDRRALSPAEP